jgi:dihydrolipoamide dehydrogenase
MTELDILIIGAGSAGERAASYSAGDDRNVGLIEKARVGGACVFNACIPTKALVHAARTYKQMRKADFYGLPKLKENAEYQKVKEFKDRIILGISEGRDERMSKKGVKVIKGTARFISPHEVMVDEKKLRAQKIIIATGSEPVAPPIKGLEDAGYLNNISIIELNHAPKRLAVIGGGPVGIEFTQIFSAFGSQVHIYEMEDRILTTEDEDISNKLSELLLKGGIFISAGVKVSEVRQTRTGKLVISEDKKGLTNSEEFDDILVAAGRKPVMDELDLSAAGVTTYKKGIKVDPSMRTNVPHIWAVGDVTGGFYFTYIASEQAKIAALNAANNEERAIHYDVLPRATFCDPEIASVGLTEAQAREKGYHVQTSKFNYADMTRAIVSDTTDGFIKIVAEEGSGRILGGHILGAEASTLIHEIAAAITGNLSVNDIGDLLHSYPTFSEGIRYACQLIS